MKNQQQVGHNHKVEQHLLDISNLFEKQLELREVGWRAFEQQFSVLSTDSRLDSGLDFDLAILTPGYVYF